MRNKHIVAKKQKLDSLFEHFRELSTLRNPSIEAQWSTYLAIRVSGLLETSLRSIYSSYCETRSHMHVSRFVGSALEGNRSQNMKPEAILNLAGSFNPLWRQELENYISLDGRKEAIESVINIRNSAAHGGTTSVSYSNIKDYYKKICEVIEFIKDQCK